MNNLDLFMEYLPIFIPLIAVELILAITALVHVLRHPNYKFGNKIIWIFVVILLQIIGPVIYFAFGRGDE